MQIKLNNAEGPVIAEVEIPQGNEWSTLKGTLKGKKPGAQDLVVMLRENKAVEVDWISFE